MKERILILLLLATVCSMQAQNIHMALRPDDFLQTYYPPILTNVP